jgi:adenylate kinase
LGEKLLLFGPPGVGKGTQAARLTSVFNIPHISTGEILRGAIQSYTPIGQRAKEYMDRGELVPDDLILGIIRERLAHPDTTRGFLMDGFPRTIPQAEALDDMLTALGKSLDRIIVLDAPVDEVVSRISGRRTCESCQSTYHMVVRPPKVRGVCDRCGGVLIQRSDDSEEIVRRRLVEYQDKTKPVLEYFKQHNWPLRFVDAVGNMDQVFGRIYAAVLLS